MIRGVTPKTSNPHEPLKHRHFTSATWERNAAAGSGNIGQARL
jgi:hypothetical protein